MLGVRHIVLTSSTYLLLTDAAHNIPVALIPFNYSIGLCRKLVQYRCDFFHAINKFFIDKAVECLRVKVMIVANVC
jgi:hypothetical protein